MGWRQRAAFYCYLLGCLPLLAFGLVYLFRAEFMPYHAIAVEQSWNEVEPAFQVLVLALMRVAGGGWVATATAIALLLFIPYRQGQGWTRWAIPAVGLPASLASLYATVSVTLNTPASPPWQAAALGVGLLAIGFLLSVVVSKK